MHPQIFKRILRHNTDMERDMNLIDSLVAIVGEANVISDAAARSLASSDLFPWPGRVVAELVVRPASTDETSRVVSLLAAAGKSMVPRGAGLSYTAGAVPHAPCVVIDSARLDRIDIHADDMYVTVGAGCVWQTLSEALKPLGLRAIQISPISGAVTTVGGLVSNNVPGGLDGVIGVTAVLADGTVADTGSAASRQGLAFQRYAGPDLTGLFLGDCGAFGIKTAVALRLAPERAAAFGSFGFARADQMLAAMTTLLRRGLVTRAFSMDQAKGRSATTVDTAEAASIVSAVVKGATSVGGALKDVAQLAFSRNVLRQAPWSLHLVVEGVSEALAQTQLDLARAVCLETGIEIDNVVPKTLRAKPYSIRGFLGVDGERWVPVHGIVPLSRAAACHAALEAHIERNASALASAGVKSSWLVSSTGTYITIEPMFYWNDELDAIHLANLSERNRSRFAGRAANPAARALVSRMRLELRDIMDTHHAIHAQVGRFYRYADLMTPGSAALVRRIKQALDPQGRMNPGVLGV